MDWIQSNFPKNTKIVFVKAKRYGAPKCFYCCQIGHVKVTCPFRRIDSQTIKNTFPLQLKGQIKQVWVQKGTRPPNMVDFDYDHKFNTWSNCWVRF